MTNRGCENSCKYIIVYSQQDFNDNKIPTISSLNYKN